MLGVMMMMMMICSGRWCFTAGKSFPADADNTSCELRQDSEKQLLMVMMIIILHIV